MKIAVLLPNHNHGRFIGRAVAAIQRQSHADWEMAIVDDASTDDSREAIAELARQDRRIVTTFRSERGGAVAALQTGYAMTTAPLVLGAAADDCIGNDRFFEAANAAFEANPRAGCVFAKAALVDGETGERYFVMAMARSSGWNPPQQCMRDFLCGKLWIHGAAAVWRRSAVDRVGGYDAALGPRADYFLNHALAALDGAVFLDEVATDVRHSQGSYGQSSDGESFFREYALVERNLMRLDLGYRVRTRWRRKWRGNVINERLAHRWQGQFFDSIRGPLAAFDPWHRTRFQDDLGEIAMRLHVHAQDWERELARRVAAAESIFDEIAGTLQRDRIDALVHWWKRRRSVGASH